MANKNMQTSMNPNLGSTTRAKQVKASAKKGKGKKGPPAKVKNINPVAGGPRTPLGKPQGTW